MSPLFSQPAFYNGIFGFVFAFFWPLPASLLLIQWLKAPRTVKEFLEGWVSIAIGGELIELVIREWMMVLGYSASALTGLVLYFIWKHRKKGKRVAKELGAKARARIEKLVRDMPRPSPGLRPVPVPVRW